MVTTSKVCLGLNERLPSSGRMNSGGASVATSVGGSLETLVSTAVIRPKAVIRNIVSTVCSLVTSQAVGRAMQSKACSRALTFSGLVVVTTFCRTVIGAVND